MSGCRAAGRDWARGVRPEIGFVSTLFFNARGWPGACSRVANPIVQFIPQIPKNVVCLPICSTQTRHGRAPSRLSTSLMRFVGGGEAWMPRWALAAGSEPGHDGERCQSRFLDCPVHSTGRHRMSTGFSGVRSTVVVKSRHDVVGKGSGPRHAERGPGRKTRGNSSPMWQPSGQRQQTSGRGVRP